MLGFGSRHSARQRARTSCSQSPAPDTVRRIREVRCALRVVCCVLPAVYRALSVACLRCLLSAALHVAADIGRRKIAQCSATVCASAAQQRVATVAAGYFGTPAVLPLPIVDCSGTTAYSTNSIASPRHRAAVGKGGAFSHWTCLLLDGLEVDVLEVLVHLEQRTAAAHSECHSPHSGAVGRARHFADLAPWLRLAAAVSSTHSL